MPEPTWTIELYEDEHGRCPVAHWLDALSFAKRSAMVTAIDEILAYEGPEICGTRYGRALGGGLCELRVRHTAAELRARFQPNVLDPRLTNPSAAGERGGILLRLFFHPHGDRQILVLAGYDKGVRPSARHQSKQIRLARRRLAEHRRRHRS